MNNHPFDYDLHTHTRFSDGRSSVPEMVNAAQSNGLRGFILTDHAFDTPAAEKLLSEYAAVDRSVFPVPVLFGVEAAAGMPDGRPNVPSALLRKFEIVLMDFNFIVFRQLAGTDRRLLADRLCEMMVHAAECPEVQILAHPFNFGLAPLNLPLSAFDNERVGKIADAFVRHGKIFEIMNQMYYWHSPVPYEEFQREYLRILLVFKNAGARFSIGSDTHSCCGLGNFRWCEKVVRELDLEDRLFLPEAFRK